MKNLLLVGDSICAVYSKSVRKTLEGKANVMSGPSARFASYLLRDFHEYFTDIKGEDIDVIHWNTGLWDCLRLFGEEPHTPIDIYAYYIERLCIRMKKICPNAKIVFATSTKVLEEKMDPNFRRSNADIEAYNKKAIEIAEKYGFEIDDLYAVSKSLPETAHSDVTHYYTHEGTEAFTKQVLSVVAPLLGINEDLEYREDMYIEKPHGI